MSRFSLLISCGLVVVSSDGSFLLSRVCLYLPLLDVLVLSDGSPLGWVCLYPPLLDVLVLSDGSPLGRVCLYPQLDVLVLSGDNPLI